MAIEKEKDRLTRSLKAVEGYTDKILAEAQTIQEIQGDIVNQIPNASDWNKVMKPLNEVTLDIGNGVAVVLQGVNLGWKLINRTLPGITYK